MVEDFNPKVGEFVEVFPREGRFEGLFEIVDIYARPDSIAFLLDLKRLKDGGLLKGIPTYLVDYPKEGRVQHALEKILPDVNSWPEDFQRVAPVVKAEEMYDGTPRTMVYFYLKPEAVASLERARQWNEFFSKIHRQLEPFTDSKWDLVQFATKEERSTFSAAS
jgi:hypothetical protein